MPGGLPSSALLLPEQLRALDVQLHRGGESSRLAYLPAL